MNLGEYDAALIKCSKMIQAEEDKLGGVKTTPDSDVYTLPYTLKANVLTQKAMLMMQSGARPTEEIEVCNITYNCISSVSIVMCVYICM